jgi:F0F1-type ATP synthase beta subunit
MKPNEMEFIDELATQITEINFGGFAYIDGDGGFTEEAEDFYNEMYDEYKNLYIALILQIPKKI